MQEGLLAYPKHCHKPGHESQQILMVCMQEKCRLNCLCCCDCIDEEHGMHEIMSLRKFQAILKASLQKNSNNRDKKQILKYMQEIQRYFCEELKELENLLVSKIAELEDKINSIFMETYRALTMPAHHEIFDYLIENYDSQSWSKIFDDWKICEKHKIGNFQDTKLMLNYQYNLFEEKLSSCCVEISKKMKQIESHIKQINFNSKKYEEPPIFHPFQKYFDMSRLDNQSFITKTKNNGNRTAALGNKPFSPVNNSIKFRIIQNGQGTPSICIGAAILNIVKKNNFTNCTGSKRGVYCIDQASTSNWGSIQPSNQATFWNHDSQIINSTIGFQFNEGDMVAMIVDFEEEMIIFEVGENIFDMKFNIMHQDLYPFVCMNNSGCVVEIFQ